MRVFFYCLIVIKVGEVMGKVVSLGARISIMDRMSSGMNRVVGSLALAAKASEKMDSSVKKMGIATSQAANKSSTAMNKMQSAASTTSEKTKRMGDAAQQASGKIIYLEDVKKRSAKAAETASQKTEQLRQKYRDLGVEAKKTVNDLEKASGAMRGIGAVTTAGGVAIAGGLTKSVQTVMQFDDAMSAVRAKTGASGKAFQELRNEAMRLGATTSFTATDAANAMDKLAMAGWENQQIMAGTEDMLNLAAAGALDLASAADIASDIMTPFKISADEAGRVADVLAKAATSANTDVRLLGETMKYAAPIANQYGMSLEQTSAIAAKMADAGIKGSEAGTAMRAGLARLATMPKPAADALHSLGVKTTDAAGNMRDIFDVIGDMDVALSKLSDSERLEKVKGIFGMEAMSGWSEILGLGEESLKSFTHELGDSTNYAAKVAEIMNDNIGGAFRMLGSAVESAMIKIGDQIKGPVKKAAEMVTKLTTKFNELSPATQKIIAFGAAGAAGFLLLLGPLLLLVSFVPNIIAGFSALVPLFGTVIAPILGVVAAITAIGVAFVVAYKKSAAFRNFVQGTFQKISAVAKAFFAVLKGGTDSASGKVNILQNLLSAGFDSSEAVKILTTFRSIKYNVIKTVESIKSIALKLFTQISAWWKKDGEKVKQTVSSVMTKVASILSKAISVIGVVFETLAPIVTRVISIVVNIFQTAFPIIASIVETVAPIVIDIIGAIVSVFQRVGSIVMWLVDNIVVPLLPIIGTIIETVWSVAGPILEFLWEAIKFVGDIVVWLIDTIVIPMIPTLGTILENVWSVAKPILDAMKLAFQWVGEKIEWVVKKLKGFKKTFEDIKNGDFSIGLPKFIGGNGLIQMHGSHATGLNRVPFDGYRAILHRDEAVLTASEAETYRKHGLGNNSIPSKPTSFGSGSAPRTTNNSSSNTIVMHNNIEITGSELAAMSEDENRFKETADKLLKYIADNLDEAGNNTPSINRSVLL